MSKGKDSIGRTFMVAVAVCAVCSVAVSVATVALKPAQDRNKKLEKRRNILAAADLLAPGIDVNAVYEARVKPRVVDLATGQYVDSIDAATFDARAAAADPARSIAIPPDRDIATIKRRSKFQTVYLIEAAGVLDKIVLPIKGLGLWSTLYGFICLDDNMRTIEGLGFYEHGETPGLGGEIDNPKWKALWRGKQAFGPDGALAIEVIKGAVDKASPAAQYKVDGLSGATITSRGVSNLVRYWLGADGYAPVLAQLKPRPPAPPPAPVDAGSDDAASDASPDTVDGATNE